MDFSSYKTFLKKEYPSAYDFLQNHNWKPLFFSDSVPLSSKGYQQMEKVVQSLFQLKNKEAYQNNLSSEAPPLVLKDRKEDSVLMAYDFHLKNGVPKLIEVNTNASGFLMVNSFYQFKNLPYKKAKEDLKNSFQSEWEKFNQVRGGEAPKKAVLIDQNPFDQKMAVEFFMYKDFFQSMGWFLEICDSHSLKIDDKGYLYTPKGDKIDFIYNRCVDFYFESHPFLAKSYEKGTCAISPHPREYYLLSDKNRLCDWSLQKGKWPELNHIKHSLLFSENLNVQNKDEIWKNRKKYFFKIHKGHGGKLVYRGAGLTRKKFNELGQLKSLIQECIPPSKIRDSQGEEWKIDFRVYVYEDHIQQLAARCYQGQLTNFRETGSGFATVFLAE